MLKEKGLGLILTQEEKWFVFQLAMIEGDLSQSSLIRRLIRQAASAHGLVKTESSVLEGETGESYK
jgi:hypothetical protein